MISDRCASAIARAILAPFLRLGYVPDGAIESAITLIKLEVELDDNEKIIESAKASVAVNEMLLDAIRSLPR